MKSSHYKLKHLLTIILLFVFSVVISYKYASADSWWMYNHGKYILENGFSEIEPFTVHEGFSFSFEKWLSCILFYKVHKAWGFIGLQAIVYLIMFFCITVAYYTVLKLTEKKTSYDRENPYPGIITLLFIIFTRSFVYARPQMFTMFFLLIELYLLETIYKDGTTGGFLILPLLSLFEMQLHSTQWMILLIVFLPYMAESLVKKSYLKESIGTFMLMALAGFINPYGYKSVIYMFKSMNGSLINFPIQEFQKITVTDIYFIFITLTAIPVILMIYKRKSHFSIRHYLLFFGLLLFSLFAIRNTLFYYTALPMLYSQFIYEYKEIYKIKPWFVVTFVSISVIFIGTACFNLMEFDEYGAVEGKECVDYVVENGGNKVYTNFNVGAYGEYSGLKCYMDARAEIFTKEVNGKEDILAEYMNLQDGLLWYKDFLDKYDFDYLIVSKYESLYNNLLHDADYKVAFTEENGLYSVFVETEK